MIAEEAINSAARALFTEAVIIALAKIEEEVADEVCCPNLEAYSGFSVQPIIPVLSNFQSWMSKPRRRIASSRGAVTPTALEPRAASDRDADCGVIGKPPRLNVHFAKILRSVVSPLTLP